MTPAATLRRLEETATASIRAAFVGTAEPSPAEMRNDHNISPPNAKATGFADERLRDFTAAQVTAVLAFLRVFEMREKIDSGAPEEALEFTSVQRPLARATRYGTARAESAGE